MARVTFVLMLAISTASAAGLAAPAQAPDNPLLITADEMLTVPVKPGEVLRIVEGQRHGFESLSVSIGETAPGSGAPPHTHLCEEAHILLSGTVRYTVGSRTFVATAPFVVRIPPGVTHSFTNIGSTPINVIGVLPRSREFEIDPDAELTPQAATEPCVTWRLTPRCSGRYPGVRPGSAAELIHR